MEQIIMTKIPYIYLILGIISPYTIVIPYVFEFKTSMILNTFTRLLKLTFQHLLLLNALTHVDMAEHPLWLNESLNQSIAVGEDLKKQITWL